MRKRRRRRERAELLELGQVAGRVAAGAVLQGVGVTRGLGLAGAAMVVTFVAVLHMLRGVFRAIAARLGQNRASGPPPEVGETPSTAAVAASEGISILGSQMEGIAA